MSIQLPPFSDRLMAAFRTLARGSVPELRFHGMYEYIVESTNVDSNGIGVTVNAFPADTSSGAPPAQSIPIRTGTPGCRTNFAKGTHLAIGFLDGDPRKPVVMGAFDGLRTQYIQIDSDEMDLCSGSAGAARVGDSVQITIDAITAAKLTSPPGVAGGPLLITVADQPSFTVSGTITGGSSKVVIG